MNACDRSGETARDANLIGVLSEGPVLSLHTTALDAVLRKCARGICLRLFQVGVTVRRHAARPINLTNES